MPYSVVSTYQNTMNTFQSRYAESADPWEYHGENGTCDVC